MVRTVHVRMPDLFPVLLQETELRLRGPTDHEDVNTYDILITASDRVASVDDPGHTCQVGDAIHTYIPSRPPLHRLQTHHAPKMCHTLINGRVNKPYCT